MAGGEGAGVVVGCVRGRALGASTEGGVAWGGATEEESASVTTINMELYVQEPRA